MAGADDVQEAGAIALLQLAEELHLLVGGQRFDERHGAPCVEQLEDVAAAVELGLVEELHRQLERQRRDHPRRRLDRELVERLRHVGGAKVLAGGEEVFLVA